MCSDPESALQAHWYQHPGPAHPLVRPRPDQKVMSALQAKGQVHRKNQHLKTLMMVRVTLTQKAMQLTEKP